MSHSASHVNGSTLPHFAPAKPKRKTKKARKPKPPKPVSNLMVAMTVGLGIGIPLLSLALSKLSGTLAAHGHYALALFAFGLMVTVLGVSLSHLAAAISHVTRSAWQASWAMAVSLDLSLVLCELVHVYATDLGLGTVCNAVMLCVALGSVALNIWAFLMHD